MRKPPINSLEKDPIFTVHTFRVCSDFVVDVRFLRSGASRADVRAFCRNGESV